LEEITGQSRNRVFRLREMFEIIEKPAAELDLADEFYGREPPRRCRFSVSRSALREPFHAQRSTLERRQ
jgi:hypothetical protein